MDKYTINNGLAMSINNYFKINNFNKIIKKL